MQSLVLVSVFRQASRERIMEWVEWWLPDRIPYVWDRLGYSATPAQMFHTFIVQRIKAFQAGVALRQSAVHPSQKCALICFAVHLPNLDALCALQTSFVLRFV